MAIHVALNHVSVYRYDRRVGLSPQVVRLRPAPHCRTPILSYSLRITPEQHFLNWQQDPYSNYLARLVFPDKVRRAARRGRPGRRDAGHQPVRLLPRAARRAVPVRVRARAGARALPVPAHGAARPALHAAISARVSRQSRAHGRLPGRAQPARPARRRLRDPHGAGRADVRGDARARQRVVPRLGLAAGAAPAPPGAGGALRLRLPDPARAGRQGARRAGGARGGLHRPARLGRGLPARGGLGRPRPDLRPARRRGPHPARLRGRAASAAAPITGRGGRRARTMLRARDVASTRVHEIPRVTKPYTEDAVAGDPGRSATPSTAISSAGDVRLTMGGEPTFVSIDDRDGAEWNTAALGPTKRELAGDAAPPAPRRASAPDGFVHFGQGKWYPGESLPRWALGCYWRRDGEPIWSDPALFADEHAATTATARQTRARFIQALADRLGVAATHCAGRATRTSGTTSGASGGCRSTSIPSTPGSRTRGARPRCARVFDAGARPGRRVRPAAASATTAEARWESGPWLLRREAACSSSRATRRWAIACRSTRCPGRAEDDHPQVIHRDPSAAFPPLPAYDALRARAEPIVCMPRPTDAVGAVHALAAPPAPSAPPRMIRPRGSSRRAGPSAPRSASSRATARCTSSCRRWPRSRTTSTWSPPSRRRPPSSELPVLLEGYPPPSDPRLAPLQGHARSRASSR